MLVKGRQDSRLTWVTLGVNREGRGRQAPFPVHNPTDPGWGGTSLFRGEAATGLTVINTHGSLIAQVLSFLPGWGALCARLA